MKRMAAMAPTIPRSLLARTAAHGVVHHREPAAIALPADAPRRDEFDGQPRRIATLAGFGSATTTRYGSEIERAGQVRGSSVFLSTGVTYPHGVGVTVRIRQGWDGYAVSDDGYANTIAESMNALLRLSTA